MTCGSENAVLYLPLVFKGSLLLYFVFLLVRDIRKEIWKSQADNKSEHVFITLKNSCLFCLIVYGHKKFPFIDHLHYVTASFQVLLGSDNASPEPPLLQTKQPQLQPPSAALGKICAPAPLSALLPFSGPTPAPPCPCSERPELDTALGCDLTQRRGDNHCSASAGHTSSDKSRDAIVLLGSLLAHTDISIKLLKSRPRNILKNSLLNT